MGRTTRPIPIRAQMIRVPGCLANTAFICFRYARCEPSLATVHPYRNESALPGRQSRNSRMMGNRLGRFGLPVQNDRCNFPTVCPPEHDRSRTCPAEYAIELEI